MAQVILQKTATLRGVQRVTRVKIGGGGKRLLFRAKRFDDDDEVWDDDVSVRIVNPRTGTVRHGEVFQGGRKAKKQSKALRPLERFIRKLVRRRLETAQNYLSRHQRSNRRRKDGWLKDLPKNVVRAVRDHD